MHLVEFVILFVIKSILHVLYTHGNDNIQSEEINWNIMRFSRTIKNETKLRDHGLPP